MLFDSLLFLLARGMKYATCFPLISLIKEYANWFHLISFSKGNIICHLIPSYFSKQGEWNMPPDSLSFLLARGNEICHPIPLFLLARGNEICFWYPLISLSKGECIMPLDSLLFSWQGGMQYATWFLLIALGSRNRICHLVPSYFS